jgi:malate dehydrogenase (oxaloacetate-decarboxylating)(NADP+)
VVLAGLYSSLRITKQKLTDQRILSLGAGEAGVGIGDLCVSAMVEEGAKLDEARKRLWFCDSKGLVVKSRTDLAHHKVRYAHDAKFEADFLAAVRAVKPTAIIGTCTIAKTFSKAVIEEMCKLNERPIIFALSNPTDKSECTAEEAYSFSNGRAIYASGSPFPNVKLNGKEFVPGQCNNSYIFPGVGLGIVAVAAKRVTDPMFAAAARSLAQQTSQSDLDMGRIYPALTQIREVSAHIGAAVAEVAFRDGFAGIPRPHDVLAHVRSQMWTPRYECYVR